MDEDRIEITEDQFTKMSGGAKEGWTCVELNLDKLNDLEEDPMSFAVMNMRGNWNIDAVGHQLLFYFESDHDAVEFQLRFG